MGEASDKVDNAFKILQGNRKVVGYLITVGLGSVLAYLGRLDNHTVSLLEIAYAIFVGGNAIEHLSKLRKGS